MDNDPEALPLSRRKSSLRQRHHENPLLINAVLENLFEMMPTADLKQCRMVCSEWNAEALRTLRRRVRMNLLPIPRQLEFLKRSRSILFKHYDFILDEWNEEVASYMRVIQPSTLQTRVKILSEDWHKTSAHEAFTDLLNNFGDRLTRLEIQVDWNGTAPWILPYNLLQIEFPILRLLQIKNENVEATQLNSLWLAMISHSPKLRSLELSKMPDLDLWKGMIFSANFIALKHLTYVPHKRIDFALLNQPIRFHFPHLSHLTIPFKEFLCPGDTRSLLSRVSATLSYLEFITTDQSALSPVLFPVMPNLLVLDAGNAVLSFPSITPEVFPKLRDLRQTYWDWVSTLENLPGNQDYWSKNDPHHGIRHFHIRFPNYSELHLDYARLKKFKKFAWVITAKFPRARNFTFYNVPLGHDVKRRMGNFFSVFHSTVESFRIMCYNPSESGRPNTFEMQPKIFKTHMERTRFVKLDLGTRYWPQVWEQNPALLSTIPGPDWIPFLREFPNLRIIRLLWAEKLLSLLHLTDTNILNSLEVLEFVGNRCVDRWERAAVLRCRPKLRLVQHKPCYCPHEDWWYIYDPRSDRVFQDLFYPNDI